MQNKYPLLITLSLLAIIGGLLVSNKNKTLSSLTPKLNPKLTTSKAGFNDIVIQARGTNGKEKIALFINNAPVEFWNLTNTFKDYTHTPNGEITVSELSIHFLNDTWEPEKNINYDVQIPYITVNGTKYNSEHSSTVSTGSWDQDNWCAPGNKQTQWLNCNGSFTYNIPVGTVVGLPQEPSDSFSITQVNLEELSDTQTKIRFIATEYAQAYIEYGITENYGQQTLGETSFTYAEHLQELINLIPATKYYYKITVTNQDGEVATQVGDFTTDNMLFSVLTAAPEQTTSTQTKLRFTTSAVAQAYTEYGTTTSYGLQTATELSFNYDEHLQTITGLSPSTKYYFRINVINQLGEKAQETGSFITSDVNTNSVGGVATSPDARDTFWQGSGYELIWSNTPTDRDYGINPLEYFAMDPWSNGAPLTFNNPSDNANISFVAAPDGSPSFRSVIKKGDYFSYYVQGRQLSNGVNKPGIEKNIVYSGEWYTPCVGGQNNNDISGTYIGTGPHWGSVDGIDVSPGGSSNSENAFSFRVPLTKRDTYFIYAYVPEKPSVSGLGIVTSPEKSRRCGQWEIVELEMIMNTPVTSQNGILRLYVNGDLIHERKNFRVRTVNGVKPKGYGMFFQHNANAPNDETTYHRNWKIYAR